MISENRSKRKRKAYYRKCAAASKRPCRDYSAGSELKMVPRVLEIGMTGYILTYNRQERLAVMEAFRLLNQTLGDHIKSNCSPDAEKRISDSLSGSEQLSNSMEKENLIKDNIDDDEDDVYSQLCRENYEEKQSNANPASRFSFYSLKTFVNNCSFILHYTTHISAGDLATHLYESLLSSSTSQSRHILRLMPVTTTCRSDSESIHNSVGMVWSQFLQLAPCKSAQLESSNNEINEYEMGKLCKDENQDGTQDEGQTIKDLSVISSFRAPLQMASSETLKGSKTFMIIFKAKNYNCLSRDAVIETVTKAVKSVDPAWEGSTSSPNVVIFINVLRKVTCISLLENFFKYRKYNLAELSPSTCTNSTLESGDQRVITN